FLKYIKCHIAFAGSVKLFWLTRLPAGMVLVGSATPVLCALCAWPAIRPELPVITNTHLHRFVCTLILIGCSAELLAAEPQLIGNASAPGERLSLWYRQPAGKWVEALAVGNGRLGAMVFGGINREQLQLNEGTLWAGGPYDPVNPEAREALPEVRRLIFEGKYRDASKLISAKVMSKPLAQMPYQTAGDLILTFPDSASVENYRRDLNLDTAVAGVEYSDRGTRFSRQIFASPVDQVIVV